MSETLNSLTHDASLQPHRRSWSGVGASCFSLALLSLACITSAGSLSARAGEVSIDDGDGGLETYISSDTNPAVNFGVFGCSRDATDYLFEVVVFIEEGASVSPFYAQMRETRVPDLQAEICMSSSCQIPQWTISDYFSSYSGQVLVPNNRVEESEGLEFRPANGETVKAKFDVNGTFAKICSK